MSTDTNLAVKQNLETAIADFLRSSITAGSALEGTHISTRCQNAKLSFPRVVVDVVRAPAQEDVNDLYMAEVNIYVATAVDEPSSRDKIRARVGYIEETVGANEGAALITATSSGSYSIVIHKVYLTDNYGEQVGEHWVDVIVLLVPVQMKNAS